MACSSCAGSALTRIAGASSSHRQAIPSASGLALMSATTRSRIATSSHGCFAGAGRRNTSAKPFMNVFSCPVRAITTPSAVSKSVRFSGDSSRA